MQQKRRKRVKPHWIFLTLVPLYGFATILRNWFFDIGIFETIDVGVPVISVGNITTGGTGKTPIVKNVATILIETGKHVAIISRGYGRKTKGTIIVSDGNKILANAHSAGDEPLFLAEQLPGAIVIVDEDRVRGAKKAIKEFGAEIIVLDDGFQNRYIKRMKDIVLMDVNQLPFNTMLLPAGYRRDLISSLRRADAIVVTKVNNYDKIENIVSGKRVNTIHQKFSSSFEPTGIHHLIGGVNQSVEILKGHTGIAFCGIARPESFQKSLELCGLNVTENHVFPDHHDFTIANVEMVIESFRTSKADFIITTEKDAIRLREFEKELIQVPIFVLDMDVVMHQKEEWKKYITSGLSS